MNSETSHKGWRRHITLHRAFLLLLLTTIGTLIVLPYFGYGVVWYVLWFRLFVVALVMMVVYFLTETMWHAWQKPRIPLLATQLITTAIGAFVGTIISGLVIGRSLVQMFSVEPMLLGIVVFTTLAIGLGAITAMVLVYRERAARADVVIVRAESTQHALEKQVLEARLKLLQAQIEPHFLFNTLANVQHLVETDPSLASRVLGNLIKYLRAALPQMREGGTTLGREVDMARAYLDIQVVRMPNRLRYAFDVPQKLRDLPFPPMMLITLVENAIKHGIDPLQQGGEIAVRAVRDGEVLLVSVADTGVGVSVAGNAGVGLANIRDRLAALYGPKAGLVLRENVPSGVIADVRVPVGAA